MTDLILHAGFSYLIMWFLREFKFSRVSAVTITLLIGVSKELFDLWSYGLFSIDDIERDILGVLLYLVVFR